MSSKISPTNDEDIKTFELERIETIQASPYRSTNNGRLTGYLLLSLLVAAIGSAFQFGWSTAIFNTPFTVIKEFYENVYKERYGEDMSKNTFDLLWSITNGLMPLGGMFGGLASGFLGDSVGRKKGLLLVNIFVVISTILNVSSKFALSYETLMIARFFTGVYCGLFSGILPLYLSECSPKNLRGTVGSLNQLSIVIGILVANILGLPELLGTSNLWPYLVGLSFIPVVAHFTLLYFPESPKFIYMKLNNKQAAEEALKKFRNGYQELVEEELNELEQEKLKLSSESQVKWGDFLAKKTLFRPLIVALVIQISQQFSGINAVIFYSTSIFVEAGLEGSWPIYGTIILGVVQIIMTFVCMIIVDRAGRRILLLSGMAGMSIFSFIIAITRIFGNEASWLNYMTVVAAVGYIIFFSIGPGAIPWLITSELFGSDSRGKATSMAVFVNWFSNFIVTVSFPFIESAIGSYSFIVFGVLLIFFSLFMLFFVPETKNKQIEEIVDMFKKKIIFFPNAN